MSLLLDRPVKTPEEMREEKKLRTMFKNRLVNATNYRPVCPFTGISDVRFLIASHIKPYAACENTGEKVDPQNGFMLSPNADKLFDCGYISFTDDGVLMMSSMVNGELMSSLGLKLNTKVLLKGDRCKEYLAYHREFVFEGVRTKVKEER
jgi:predicted restriction endonuclease